MLEQDRVCSKIEIHMRKDCHKTQSYDQAAHVEQRFLRILIFFHPTKDVLTLTKFEFIYTLSHV